MTKLTKSDIDKVRGIEGFPRGRDEDIIALSRPPYYTACPNPFIEDFIRGQGTPYDEATDDYHREPFAADVSEGKNDPIYNAHSYHTKVPHKAIMRYILHYTRPGDIVFDGFCGTGMTGVAAQMCGCPDAETKYKIEQEFARGGYEKPEWGARKAILSDLSPAATFIAYNYNKKKNPADFISKTRKIVDDCEVKYGWMYETNHRDQDGNIICAIDGKPVKGKINYAVWSDVFICPSCSKELVFFDVAYDVNAQKVRTSFICPYCGASLAKDQCERAKELVHDPIVKQTVEINKQVIAYIDYSVGKKRFQKKPDDDDFRLLENISILLWDIDLKPIPMMLKGGTNWGEIYRAGYHYGISYVHQFYTYRNYTIVNELWEQLKDTEYSWILTSILNYINKKQSFTGGGGGMPGVLYIASLVQEKNVFDVFRRKITSMSKAYNAMRYEGESIVSTQSSTDLRMIATSSVDYIFIDPPFGGNIMYSEASFLMESLLKVYTNNTDEAIQSSYQNKELIDYQILILKCFREFFRILKPYHWLTMEFHNSQNAVWNVIQESLLQAGFVIADIRILDKVQGSFKQVTTHGATQKDLVISAYKPKESFVREFQEKGGDPDMAWAFVRQHLANVPVTAVSGRDGKLEVIAERRDYLLFDRMVAWHIMNGVPVPLDAHDFYAGLRERFIERDGMFFLPDQVNEYDEKRMILELEDQQLSMVVTNEKTAIQWLYNILGDGPKTYQEIQPLYLPDQHLNKTEKLPELLDMLKDNFIQDDHGAWYIPDPAKAADKAKLRRKNLLKEFRDYVKGSGKLRTFRMEAIRAGFDECWKQRDYDTIVRVGGRLPDSAFEDDAAILMYYDNACARAGKQA